METDNAALIDSFFKIAFVWLLAALGYITPVLQALVLLASLVYTIVQIRIAILKLREKKAKNEPD